MRRLLEPIYKYKKFVIEERKKKKKKKTKVKHTNDMVMWRPKEVNNEGTSGALDMRTIPPNRLLYFGDAKKLRAKGTENLP